MPYLEKYQVGITYEIDSTQHNIERQDFTVFEWISNVGGLGFLFTGATVFVGWLNSPQLWITSAMLQIGKEHKVMENRSQTLSRQLSMSNYSHEQVQQKCCSDLTAKWAQLKCVPKCCRGTKARILSRAHEDMKKEMHITHVLKQMRATEGIIRDKLEMSEKEWKTAFARFSSYSAKFNADSSQSYVDHDGSISGEFENGNGRSGVIEVVENTFGKLSSGRAKKSKTTQPSLLKSTSTATDKEKSSTFKIVKYNVNGSGSGDTELKRNNTERNDVGSALEKESKITGIEFNSPKASKFKESRNLRVNNDSSTIEKALQQLDGDDL